MNLFQFIICRYTIPLEKVTFTCCRLDATKIQSLRKGPSVDWTQLIFFSTPSLPPPFDSYNHQWTLRRQFHVSPFNDRSGFYTISIQSPEHSPRHHLTPGNTELRPPLPAVWVRVYTEPDVDPNTTSVQSVPAPSSDCSPSTFTRPSVGELKLAAYLRSTSALPLNTGNVIRELIKQPLALFLTMPRILYQAWILHFSRQLNVFPRPEPHPFTTQPASVNANGVVPGGGVGWQSEGTFDSYARRIVTHFLKRRVQETGISVLLIPSNPNITPLRFLAPETATDTKILEISYLSSRFYTILFSCPSSEHALLLGSSSEEIFQVSSSDLFTTVFCSDMHDQSPSLLQATLQKFRQSRVPATLKMTSPSVHCLDTGRPVTSLITSTLVLWCLTVLDYLEKTIFQLTGSKFVEGQEPWNGWKRAVETRTNNGKAQKPFTAHGSVRCAP